jgi:hypothetical protein
MIYEYCDDCPDCLRNDVRESNNGWIAIYEYRFCEEVLTKGRPRYIDNVFTTPTKTKSPRWCPLKQNNSQAITTENFDEAKKYVERYGAKLMNKLLNSKEHICSCYERDDDVLEKYGFEFENTCYLCIHLSSVKINSCYYYICKCNEPIEVPFQPLALSSQTDEIVQNILRGERRDLLFGTYKWRVLDVKDDKALIMTEEIIERIAYHIEPMQVIWQTCSLQKYLNSVFFDSLNLEATNCNRRNCIFLLNLDEVKKYIGGYLPKPSNANHNCRTANENDNPNLCWLRFRDDYIPGVTNHHSCVSDVVQLHEDGITDFDTCDVDKINGIRPAVWLSFSEKKQKVFFDDVNKKIFLQKSKSNAFERFYIAYGENTNPDTMKTYSGHADYICNCILDGYELVFAGRGDCNVTRKEGSQTVCALWGINCLVEMNLDVFWGYYPEYYDKKEMNISIDDTDYSAFLYIMLPEFGKRLAIPNDLHVMTIRQGYIQLEIPGSQLDDALERVGYMKNNRAEE